MRWLAFLVACSEIPVAPESTAQSVPAATLCRYEMTAPSLSGTLPNRANDGVDCVPPEGGDVFTLGFAWSEGLIQITASRPAGEWRIYARTSDGWCVDWSGEVAIEDLPDWSVTFDVRCPDLHFAGRIDSGR